LHDLKDDDVGKLTQRVQRVGLSKRLERCFAQAHEISVRPLSQNLTDDMVRALNEFRHQVSGRPCETNKSEWLKVACDGMVGANKEDLSCFVCSERVAEAYQKMKLLTEKITPNESVRKNFSDA
jgi:hypothetical protein